jgi:hypothetical protein
LVLAYAKTNTDFDCIVGLGILSNSKRHYIHSTFLTIPSHSRFDLNNPAGLNISFLYHNLSSRESYDGKEKKRTRLLNWSRHAMVATWGRLVINRARVLRIVSCWHVHI